MPFVLDKWDQLINSTLNPLNVASLIISEETIDSLVVVSELERKNVRNLLIEGVIDRQKVIDKQQYVQIIQGMLIRLLDKLHTYKQVEGSEKLMSLYDTIGQHVEDILNFIEDFFGNYIDRNEKVPTPYLLILIEELSGQLLQLQEFLELNSEIEAGLSEILIRNFNEFCSIKSKGRTYNELLYQKDLMNELLSEKVLQAEGSIKEVLFYFNFNDDDYVAYLFTKLKVVTEDFVSNKEKISTLRYEQKTINQLKTRPNCYLSPNMPSLKEQVNRWIEEEIKFLQAEPDYSIPAAAGNENGDKIQTSLSVSKLALLVRLMVIDKVITNRVVAHVLRVVIRMVATAQSENIGFSSFESKYHKTDKGTTAAVKDMLFRWINILNQL